MQVEVLTREEVVKIVQEQLSKVSSDITELRSSVESLKQSMKQVEEAAASVQPATRGMTLPDELKASLGSLADLVDIQIDGRLISLKPKRYLSASDFRAIGEIARRHGGYWASRSRAFVIQLTETSRKAS